MFRLDRTTKRIFISSAACYLVAVAVLLVSVAFAGSSSSMSRSKVSRLPTAPFSIDAGLTSVWTGKELIVSGQTGAAPDRSLLNAVDVAAAYNPETDTWRLIAPAPASAEPTSAAWNGRELIVLAAERGMSVALAYDPAANRWRRLETIGQDAGQGRVLAAGRTVLFLNRSLELVYFPTEDRWQPLPRRRLGRRLDSAAVWTGQQLIVFDGARAVALTPPRHAPPELPQCCGGG